MSASTLSHTTDTAASALEQYGTEIVEVVGGHANPGITNREFRTGDRFRLTTRRDNVMPISVYADRADHMLHLQDKEPGYRWGHDDPDEPGNPLGFEFVYLGLYEYIGARLDQTTLEITTQFRRVAAVVSA